MAMPEEWLAAAESLLDDEFNAGVSEPQSDVEQAGAPSGDTPELKVDAQGRAHDAETGKFVSLKGDEDSAEEEVPADAGIEPEAEQPEAEAEEEVEAEATTEEIEELILELEPDHPFFAKYGGDPDKALKALEEAQSMVGRKGQELGDVRQELQQLRELVQQGQQQQHFQPAYYGPYESDIDENPEALVYEALERGDGQTVQKAIEAWGEIEPFKAATFVTVALPQMLQSLTEPQEQYQAQPAPTTDLASEFASFMERHPDANQHLQGINQVLMERPHLAAAVQDGDPKARTQAFEDAYLLARSQSSASDTSAAARKIVLRAKLEADQAKSDAAVVRASRSSAAETRPKGNDALQQVLRDVSGLDDLVIV